MSTKKHEHDEAAKAAPATAAAPKADMDNPYSASINEPQTISLPLPDGTSPPQPVAKAAAPETGAALGDETVDDPDLTDPDEMEGEIDEALEEGDARKTGKKKKGR